MFVYSHINLNEIVYTVIEVLFANFYHRTKISYIYLLFVFIAFALIKIAIT